MGWPIIESDPVLSSEQLSALNESTRGEIGCLIGGPGTGKAQPLDALVLTPSGFVSMDKVHRGCLVIGGDGNPIRVIGVYPQGMKSVYRVTFSDGASTECTSDHLWFTATRNERKRRATGMVRSTKEIQKTLDRGDGSLTNHQIPMAAPVEFEQQEYTLHPYLLGLLLGDGCFRTGVSFSNPEEFLVDAVRSLIPAGMGLTKSGSIDYRITGGQHGGRSSVVLDCLRDLDLMGKLSVEKHIPAVYLFGSSINRISLLQGLLDTDAYTDGCNIEYSTSSPRLAKDFRFLVQSLGGTSSVSDKIPGYTYLGENRLGARSWRILVKLPSSIQPFRLPRKLNKYVPRTKYPPRRYFVSIEDVGKKNCQCISVESPDGLYLTNDFIVTHNTTTLAVLLKETIRLHGAWNIAAASPTGKAAVRMGESLQERGIDLRATTIHSLLGVATSTEKDGWGFKHDEKSPLEYKFICIDESSMCDLSLVAALLRATAKGTCILWVGDCGQLPPVGPGAPLRDMIAAGVPTGNLTRIYRNAGTVVRACKAIREGEFNRFALDEKFQLEPNPDDQDSPRNAKIVPARNNADAAAKIVDFVRGLRDKTIPVNLKEPAGPRRPIDLLRDIQVIVATNGVRSGVSELSRMEMNKRLQAELNPAGQCVAGSVIKTGDKIIGTKNGYLPIVEDDSPYFDPAANQVDLDDSGEKVRVCNGEIGWCIGQEEKIIYARFEAPLRVFKVPRGKQAAVSEDEGGGGEEEKTATGTSFDLGYAITAHRSQGSQFPIVLFGIDESAGARMVLSREAVYTILSRMQWFVAMFGKRLVLDGFCKRLALAPRKTYLTDMIQAERMKLT